MIGFLVLLLAVAVNAQSFTRISTFFACRQLAADCNVENVTVSEVVDVSGDTLVYTDSALGKLGERRTAYIPLAF